MSLRSKLLKGIIIAAISAVGFGLVSANTVKADDWNNWNNGGNVDSWKSWKYEKIDTSWIDRSRPMIAFAFDDGPVSSQYGTTGMRIIYTLEQNKQHATFFYWGNKINDSNKDEIGYANYVGCEIGNHTWTHTDMTTLSTGQINNEIEQCRAKLQSITGLSSFLVRPPYLSTNDAVKNAVNVPMITCSKDTKDWDGASADQIANTLRSAQDGDILLMHENYDSTATAVERVVPELVSRGYQIVSISELAAVKGINLQKGQVYSYLR